MHTGIFLRVRNPIIMVGKSENERKYLFWAHFYVVAAILKGPIRPKIQSLKIDNCDALQEIYFGFLEIT